MQHTAPTTPSLPSRERINSTLTTVIATIDFAKEVVPLEIAKGVLTSMSGFLSLIVNTMKNKDDFIDLAGQCKEIGLLLWHATSKMSNDDPTSPLIMAIEDLDSSVQQIYDAISEKIQRDLGGRVVSVVIDREEIAGWKKKLDDFLSMFNTKLAIMANVTLEHIAELFESTRDNSRVLRSDSPLRILPPAKPVSFFGRAAIVQEVIHTVIKPKHVALIGPGGIGKTSIAKAVVNDEAILERFGNERYFAAFDDHDTFEQKGSAITLDTFAGRLANVLGLKPSKTNKQSLVLSYLGQPSRGQTLLVLDNAETFLQAGKDTGRITSMIDELGALPSVVIMLTTRSGDLPSNLQYDDIIVPPLELDAARAAFAAVYHSPIDPGLLDRLLVELDFHPLSINLLAQAARQNRWSPQELLDAWKEQKIRALEMPRLEGVSAGKNQSLAVSIELSLSSNTFHAVNPDGLHILQIIAFLPQGINRSRMKELLPTSPKVYSIITTICKLSLAYRKADFITMLAPIRMHILYVRCGSTPYTIDTMPLLTDVRDYYRAKLAMYVSVEDEESSAEAESWVDTEDLNVERLILNDLEAAKRIKDLEESSQPCLHFIRLLDIYKPRPSILGEKLLALSNRKPQKLRQFFHFPSVTNRFLLTRARSLVILGGLAWEAMDLGKSVSMFEAAREDFRGLRMKNDVMSCLKQEGEVYTILGLFPRAMKLLTKALSIAQKTKDVLEVARLNSSLSILAAFMGRADASHLAAVAREILEREGANHDLPDTVSCQGYIAYFSREDDSSKQFFEEEAELALRFSMDNYYLDALQGKAAVAQREKNMEEAVRLLDECRTVCLSFEMKDDFKLARAAPYLAERACVAADTGDYDLARTSITQAITDLSTRWQGEGNYEHACAVYTSARIELLAGSHMRSKELFHQGILLFDALSEVRMKARSHRALGEIALLERESQTAISAFETARSICGYMGISPEYLYVCFDSYALPDRFGGWQAFLDGRLYVE